MAADSSGNTPAEQQAVTSTKLENVAAVAAMLALEREAVSAASAPLRTAIANIFRLMAGRYVILAGALDRPATPEVTRQLSETLALELETLRAIDPTPALEKAATDASRLGLEYANRRMTDAFPDTTPHPPEDTVRSPEVEQLVREAPGRISKAVDDAQEFAEAVPAADWAGVVQQVGKAAQAATSLEKTTAQVVATAHNDSIQSVAAAKGARLLWVAEPDACVVCLALSGHLADPNTGEWFDEEATFGKPGSAMRVWPPGQPLKGPPRHPHCRCVPELWFGASLPVGHPGETSLYNAPDLAAQVDLPAALRREAKRSVLYGWSLPSESGTVRLKAAERLLAKGAGLPKSVEERARKAVKAGKFDNRIHPSKRTAKR